MKKPLIILLMILPFLLVVVIGIAGRIIGENSYVNAESVVYVDSEGTTHDSSDKFMLEVQLGETIDFTATVVPSNASLQKLTYIVEEDILTIADGKLTTLSEGTTKVTVKLDNSRLELVMYVKVVDRLVSEIKIDNMLDSIKVNQVWVVEVIVISPNALNKVVTFAMADSTIATVDNAGRVIGKKQGSTTLTITAQNGVSATFNVVVSGQMPGSWIDDSIIVDRNDLQAVGSGNAFNLLGNIYVDRQFIGQITFKLSTTVGQAEIREGYLIVASSCSYVKVELLLDGESCGYLKLIIS